MFLFFAAVAEGPCGSSGRRVAVDAPRSLFAGWITVGSGLWGFVLPEPEGGCEVRRGGTGADISRLELDYMLGKSDNGLNGSAVDRLASKKIQYICNHIYRVCDPIQSMQVAATRSNLLALGPLG